MSVPNDISDVDLRIDDYRWLIRFSHGSDQNFIHQVLCANFSLGSSVQAEIEGTGTACAEGFAAGDALATALVDIAVEVTLKVVEEEYGSDAKDKVEDGLDKVVNEATGEAVGRAVASVISSAWASAYQSVCTKGELVEGFDSSFARQVREAAAYLFAEVSVSLCEEKEGELWVSVSFLSQWNCYLCLEPSPDCLTPKSAD